MTRKLVLLKKKQGDKIQNRKKILPYSIWSHKNSITRDTLFDQSISNKFSTLDHKCDRTNFLIQAAVVINFPLALSSMKCKYCLMVHCVSTSTSK
ncbi:hypothetical protein BpHYR1_004470 [Brachionus plicatilis]|uniref:Uncharacterized protein n=1 Tax=Brachionus plicatilis TaxID=10195 RepID=A0A3M7S9K4_BRAPC|nr:hypothetical protein BpHYR1_004470 [Brachionus plicatilis]